jgi:heme exporter protein C
MSDQPATPLLEGRRAARDRRTIGWAAAGLTAAGLVVGLTLAPPDAVQGQAQRLMYLHVPAAWTAYLAFFTVLIASGAVLIWADPRWDRAAQAAAELGLAATVLAFAAGTVWGRLSWGVWWAWDPRIVSTIAMFLVYAAQLTVRRAYSPRRAAWLGVGGFAVVPVVHFSVVWFRSLHQQATILAPRAAPPIDGLMLTALVLCVFAATTTAGWLFLSRLATLERRAGVPAAAPRRTAAVRS